MKTKQNTTYMIKRLTALAMLAALAYVIHFVHIPVGFLNLDFKDVIMTVCGMYFGPLSGLAVAVLVPLLEFLTVSETGVYGLIMNLLSSVTFVGIASLVYRFKKTMMGAVVGLVAAVLAMTSVMMVANFLVTPYYMGVSVEDVVALLPTLLLPFNAVKAILNASLTLCLYKPMTAALRRSGFGRAQSVTEEGRVELTKTRTIVVMAVGIGVSILSLCTIFFMLGGRIAFF